MAKLRVKCEINGKWCELPEYISQFFIKKSMIYVCTMDRRNNPFIQSLIFVNEPEKCSIMLPVKKSSLIAENLKHKPLLTLTLDKTHPTDPLGNEGIMIEATTRLLLSQNEVQCCYTDIQKKYGIDVTTKILGMEVLSDYMTIQATPRKIVYWKGPFFQKFTCQRR